MTGENDMLCLNNTPRGLQPVFFDCEYAGFFVYGQVICQRIEQTKRVKLTLPGESDSTGGGKGEIGTFSEFG